MAWDKHKIVADTDPPNPESGNELARWFSFADLALHQGHHSRQESAPAGIRAHEEHRRIKEEREALDTSTFPANIEARQLTFRCMIQLHTSSDQTSDRNQAPP
jgi:hypothetical protein